MKKIIQGHIKEMINAEEDLFKSRINVCKACPLYKRTTYGPVCNGNLYINPINKEVSLEEKKGFIRGCGCRLNAKTRVKESKCPADFW